MPKVGAVWVKTTQDGGIKHTGKIEIEGQKYWLDLYPKQSNGNPKAPSFDVYMKPMKDDSF